MIDFIIELEVGWAPELILSLVVRTITHGVETMTLYPVTITHGVETMTLYPVTN